MARNITGTENFDFEGINVGKVAFVKVTGSWAGMTVEVQTRNGNDEWETYPINGTLTEDSAYYYQLGDESGVRLAASGSGGDLWAQVTEYKP